VRWLKYYYLGDRWDKNQLKNHEGLGHVLEMGAGLKKEKIRPVMAGVSNPLQPAAPGDKRAPGWKGRF